MPNPFLYADLTGPIVDFCVNVIDSTGLAGIFLLMAAGSACIPIPSEAVMLFAGFNVSSGDQTLIGVTLAGLAGNMVGLLADLRARLLTAASTCSRRTA